MKSISYLLVALAASVFFIVSCKNVNYRKTQSGLLYKLFPGDGKDSLIKNGQIVKFNFQIKYNDSLMERFSSYGKMPGYTKVEPLPKPSYDFSDILPMMRKGDSAVIVQLYDTIAKSYPQLMQRMPPNAKKGDRMLMTLTIAEVFSIDSVARADFDKEMERDKPRQMKEQEEEMAKMKAEEDRMNIELQKEQDKEIAEMEQSGEAAGQIKVVEDYLRAKHITAQKTGKGTYVRIDQKGAGPAVTEGKFVNVKYTGRVLATDSVFQSSTYGFTIGPGRGGPIRGWHEGLLLFNQGGKGTLYIPGFLAYGRKQGPFGVDAALIFDVEVLEVSDTPAQ